MCSLAVVQPVLKATMVSAFENTKQYIAFDCNFQNQLGTLHSGANLALEDAADLAAFLVPTSEARAAAAAAGAMVERCRLALSNPH